jgi:uncharacterized small protein (DUF1192 family)
MSKRDIRTEALSGGSDLPHDLAGLRRTLADALRRIEALEDEIARLRGEKPAHSGDREAE